MGLRQSAITAALLAAFPAVSHSQAATSTTATGVDESLENVVVTARKRTESLVDVPIAISAVSGERLDEFAITSVADASRLVPGIYVDQVPAGPRVSMRGLGNAQTSGVLDTSVGLGIDGVFYGRPRWLSVGMLDVASFEVLRGPQSTYYGKNTTAGLINITTRGPGDVVSGSVRAGYESEVGGYDLEGAVGGPIGEKFGARVAIRYVESDGHMHVNDGSDDQPHTEDLIGRVTLTWAPTEDLDFTYKFTGFDSDMDGNAQEYGACSELFRSILASVNSPEDCTINHVRSPGAPIPGGQEQSAEGTTSDGVSHVLTAVWDIGGYSLSSVTGYQDMEADWVADGDWIGLLDFFNVNRPESYDQFSQELRLASPQLGRLSFTAGVYYDDASKQINQNLDVVGFSSTKPLKVDSKSWALFGELTLNVTENINLLVGGRYTEEEQDARISETQGFPSPIDTVAYDVSESRKTDDFSPALTAQWNFSKQGQVYASYTEGFKSGGFDLDLADPTDVGPDGNVVGWQFDDEHAESYELGLKSELFDRRVLLTAAVFQTKFDNLQVQSYNGDSISAVTVNAAAATTQGVELEAHWAATDELMLGGSLSLIDTEYDSFRDAPCYQGQTIEEGCTTNAGSASTQDLTGSSLPLAPDTTATFSVEWHHEVFDGHELQLGADISYRSEVSLLLEQDPLVTQDDVTLVNARIGIAQQAGGWNVAVIARNLFDETYTTGAVALFGIPDSYVFNTAAPRTVELRVGYDF